MQVVVYDHFRCLRLGCREGACDDLNLVTGVCHVPYGVDLRSIPPPAARPARLGDAGNTHNAKCRKCTLVEQYTSWPFKRRRPGLAGSRWSLLCAWWCLQGQRTTPERWKVMISRQTHDGSIGGHASPTGGGWWCAKVIRRMGGFRGTGEQRVMMVCLSC
jgi:hypothetical protein